MITSKMFLFEHFDGFQALQNRTQSWVNIKLKFLVVLVDCSTRNRPSGAVNFTCPKMPHQKFKTRREWNDAAIYNRDITIETK